MIEGAPATEPARLAGMLGFLGCGNMGVAILDGLLASGRARSTQVIVYETDEERADAVAHRGAALAVTPAELAAQCDTLLLAVKPQVMAEAVAPMREGLRAGTLVISIAAGLTLARLREMLAGHARLVRVMPNTPSLVGYGAAGFACGPGCTEADAATVRNIFEAVGLVEAVDEPQLDALTALSGSGPAYFFRVTECLIEAAVAEGLPRAAAERLAAQTVLGAGALLAESGEDAATLRARVTSPGGTTQAALETFEARGLQEVLAAGVHAAAARSRELAGG